MNTIVIRPLITEKTLNLAARGWYTFEVSPDSSKPTIAGAVSIAYKVKVVDVRTLSMHGKMRKVGKLMKHVKKADWKKAIVKLAKGQKIEVFEVTPQQEKKEKQAEPAKK